MQKIWLQYTQRSYDIAPSFGIEWEKNTRGGTKYLLYKTEKERAGMLFFQSAEYFMTSN